MYAIHAAPLEMTEIPGRIDQAEQVQAVLISVRRLDKKAIHNHLQLPPRGLISVHVPGVFSAAASGLAYSSAVQARSKRTPADRYDCRTLSASAASNTQTIRSRSVER